MLTIYGVYRSRASRNIWLAHELGLPFKHVPVIQAYRLANPDAADAPLNTRSPAFLKVNPNGHIPAIDDDGLVLCESLAINLYLVRKHGGPLAGADAAEVGQMLQWSFWAACEVEPHSVQVLYHRVMKPVDQRDEKFAQTCIAALRTPFATLDAALAKTGFLVGGRFTVADLNVAEVIRQTLGAPELYENAPHVKAWLTACHARKAYKDMAAVQAKE